MNDLSDDELAAICRRTLHPDCCRFIPLAALREAIAEDRARNGAPAAYSAGVDDTYALVRRDTAPIDVPAMAAALVDAARRQGLVLTIEQRPLKPLAQGHHETVVSVRVADPNGTRGKGGAA